LAAAGLTIEKIGILAAVYPAVRGEDAVDFAEPALGSGETASAMGSVLISPARVRPAPSAFPHGSGAQQPVRCRFGRSCR
jgi:hypothetical protein